MVFRLCAFLALSILLVEAALSGHMVHYEKCDLQQYAIGEHTFTVQRDLIDSKLAEQWKVDGVIVDESTYDKAISEAEQAARVAEREQERAQLIETAEELENIQRSAACKLFVVQLESVEKELKRIQDYDLDPHLIWSEDTISSRIDYDELVQITVPEAQKIRLNNQKNTAELRTVATRLEDYSKRVHKLFLVSVDHVIAHTNDTKLLKRLMDLV